MKEEKIKFGVDNLNDWKSVISKESDNKFLRVKSFDECVQEQLDTWPSYLKGDHSNTPPQKTQVKKSSYLPYPFAVVMLWEE